MEIFSFFNMAGLWLTRGHDSLISMHMEEPQGNTNFKIIKQLNFFKGGRQKASFP